MRLASLGVDLASSSSGWGRVRGLARSTTSLLLALTSTPLLAVFWVLAPIGGISACGFAALEAVQFFHSSLLLFSCPFPCLMLLLKHYRFMINLLLVVLSEFGK